MSKTKHKPKKELLVTDMAGENVYLPDTEVFLPVEDVFWRWSKDEPAEFKLSAEEAGDVVREMALNGYHLKIAEAEVLEKNHE